MAPPLDRSPTHLLHRAGQCAADLFQAEVPDLTPRQLIVLMTVAGDEGVSQTKLGEVTGVDRSTLSDVVERLERKGLLQRSRSQEDARANAVKLTDEGRRVLTAAEPAARRVDKRVIGLLPRNQREAFLKALRSIVAALDPGSRGED